jgi:hypothetical protein
MYPATYYRIASLTGIKGILLVPEAAMNVLDTQMKLFASDIENGDDSHLMEYSSFSSEPRSCYLTLLHAVAI